ncbi:substrate-binding domain-containing protein [Okeania sp.]|uniref:substrate-binding domain-containing protein n=1 Tax=Okeania sp. TaxID=3100323 RepID=UPI002B4B5100|nr:substrate-binding domain-containing protein [Okeania sp.]MEB3343137.1 substrate-binding domain-containing protein [Okeania sp.]
MRFSRIWMTMLSLLVLLPMGCTFESNQTSNISSTGSESSQEKQTIKIGGAGTPYPAMKLLASAYQKQTSGTKIDFIESSQTGGGIAGVKVGLIEMGTVTRPPKPKETADQLTYREFAKDALLVATHSSVEGVKNLTTEDLRAIYSGQITNWQEFGGPDATIVVLDRPEDESGKKLLRKYYLGSDLENSPDAIVLRREADLIDAIQTTPYSIGAFSLGETISNNLQVNRLSLNGVAPTPENLQSGKYTMVRSLGIVWYDDPNPATQAFIDFIYGKTGADVLQQAGFVPTKLE